jgi:hypothetical protein
MTRRSSLAVILASSAFAQSNDDSAVLQALDAFMDGWNSRDPAKYADALFFPHLILDDGHFSTYASREQFVAKGKALWASAPPEWDHSVWIKRQIVQRIEDTVHVTGTWARKDKAGRTIHTADVLYVVVRRDGQWRIFARSGSRGIGIARN